MGNAGADSQSQADASHWLHVDSKRYTLQQRNRISPFHATTITYQPVEARNHLLPNEQPIVWSSRHHRKQLSHAHQHSPTTTSHPSTTSVIGFFHRYVWCFRPQYFAWHFALSWFLGSLMFIISPAALLFPAIRHNQKSLLAVGSIIALTGATLFSYGAVCQVLEVLQAPVSFDPLHARDDDDVQYRDRANESTYTDTRCSSSGSHSEDNGLEQLRSGSDDANKHHRTSSSDHAIDIHLVKPSPPAEPRPGYAVLMDSDLPLGQRLLQVFGQWRRIDYCLSVTLLLGSLLFQISTTCQVGWWPATVAPTPQPALFFSVNIACDIAGCCCFTIASYMMIIEVSHSYLSFNYTSISWWAMACNVIGSLFFLVNAVNWIFYYSTALEVYNQIPLLLGGCFFTLGTYYSWQEQCKAAG